LFSNERLSVAGKRSGIAALAADSSVSAVVAGFLAVLVSYAGPLVIFFHAAEAGNFPKEMVSSWIWAISLGAAASGIWLSWRTKTPVITAWSAPGTALLVSLFPALSLNQAVGAYITAAVAIFLIGWAGYFDAIIRRIPKGVASGMMAGILFQFGTQAFKSATAMPVLGVGMVLAYLVFKRFVPRYCIVLVLLVIVSLTGQHLPGMAILRHAGYDIPARPILMTTSLVSVVVACFGGITIVIAAITAAFCTGSEAHEDPARRYVAGISNGVFYLLGGLFSGAMVLLFAALPGTFVTVLAGVALIGAITANVMGVVQDEEHREAAIITFLATASGMSYLSLGSAFWGVLIGAVAYGVLRRPARA